MQDSKYSIESNAQYTVFVKKWNEKKEKFKFQKRNILEMTLFHFFYSWISCFLRRILKKARERSKKKFEYDYS